MANGSEPRCPDHGCIFRHWPGHRRAAGQPWPPRSSAASAHPQRHVRSPALSSYRSMSAKRLRLRPALKRCAGRAGRIDVLINNAGVNLVGAIEETSIGQAQALFDTNVIGVLRMIQAVLPGMRRQGAGQIVNISSILGFLPAPFMGVYASTKHAIEGLSESLDHEVRAFGIRVVLIEPPYTKTNLDASAAQAEGGSTPMQASAAARRQRSRTTPTRRPSRRSSPRKCCDRSKGPIACDGRSAEQLF